MAGTLIRETAGAADEVAVGIGNKAVPNVDANQALLLHGLDLYRLRVGTQSRPILLDGHFSLLNGAGQIVAIPLSVFVAIAPVAIVLVEASADTVRWRLLERDKEAPPLEAISALADCERGRAAEVSAALGIPLWTVSAETPAEQAAASAAGHLRSLFGGEA
jgi:adenylate kinase